MRRDQIIGNRARIGYTVAATTHERVVGLTCVSYLESTPPDAAVPSRHLLY